MDFQAVLAVNLLTMSAFLALGLIVARRSDLWSFAGVNILIVLIGVAALNGAPEQAGVIVAGLFLPLVAAPLVLWGLQARVSRRGEVKAAARYASLAAMFHPSPNARLGASLARLAALNDGTQKSRALAELTLSLPPRQAGLMEARQLADRGAWRELLRLSERPELAENLRVHHLRALGELGRVDELMRSYERARAHIPPDQASTAWLFVLAFGGRPELVDRLATKVLRVNEETAEYWRAIAKLHAGFVSSAAEALMRLSQNDPQSVAASPSRRRLEAGLAAPAPLSPKALAIVESVAAQATKECARSGRGFRLPFATATLVALNSGAFLLELYLGGSENLDNLVRLGALWPPLVLQQAEAWRLLTAACLHYGWMHFSLNMLMLSVIGRDVEAEIGTVKLLGLYVAGALASSSFVLGMMAAGTTPYGVYVGASGAIFALFGALALLRIADWRRHRSALHAYRSILLVCAMAIQVGADYLLPMSSTSAHLSGFVFGAIFALLLGMFHRDATT